jgi:D-serine deaminase-like pyridoxal phosphate-dependent protein
MDWYSITDIHQLDTPALVVYPDRIKENIRLAIEMVGDPARLRPHVKTHKSPETTRLMLDAGIRSFKCATIAEAEMLALAGAEDVLLAYQPIGPKAARLAALIKKYPDVRLACLIDNEQAATAMAAVFAANGLTVPVWLDLNVGMDRTGIVPGDEAVQLYKEALSLKGITPVGLHAYDGHIRDADLAQRTRKCDEGFAKVTALRDNIAALASSPAPTPVPSPVPASDALLPIIAGGSPTFPIHSRRAAVQCSPGTFVYWDKGYSDSFKEQPFSHAALVVTRVISLRGDTRLCLDLGHKSIAPENELSNRVYFLNGPHLRPVGQSEEHLVVEAGPNHGYTVGDVFFGVPIHICPTVALYERALTIQNGKITGEFKNTARDRFLSV